MSLRAKAIVPVPLVTLIAALFVGAYGNLARNGTLRFTIALGIALVTMLLATVVYLVVTRSSLAPIDDLIGATRRVRQGDLRVHVPIVTDDELGELTYSFNAMLADLRRSTEELRASRGRIVAAGDEERRRVERDLHDGAQQQLVLIGLKLGMLERLIADPKAAALARELHGDIDRALAELRDLAHGLYPVQLESDGLRGALRDAVQRAAIPASLDCDGARRYRPELEAAVYFCCLEALQNAAKHAGPGAHAQIRLSERDQTLHFQVSDDGHGHDGELRGAGIRNMSDRIGALGGTIQISSTPHAGTTIAGTIPLEAG
jgi:signal transduction histidine kinase